MDSISRRRILLSLAALGSAGLAVRLTISDKRFFSSLSGKTPTYNYLRFGEFAKTASFNKEFFYPSASFTDRYACQFDLNSRVIQKIAVSASPHVIETHTSNPNLSLCATQKADTICSVDWEASAEVGVHKLGNGAFFYGHAVFLPDGKSVLATIYRAGRRSVIAEFSFPDLRPLVTHEIQFGTPHEILMLNEQTVIFGGSDKLNAAFGILDIKTGEEKSYPVRHPNPKPSVIAHLERRDSDIVGTYKEISRDRMGASGVARFDGRQADLILAIEDSKFQTEILSIANNTLEDELWMTVPDDLLLAIWSQRSPGIERLTTQMLKIAKSSPNALAHDPARGVSYLITSQEILILNSHTRKIEARLEKPAKGYAAHARLV